MRHPVRCAIYQRGPIRRTIGHLIGVDVHRCLSGRIGIGCDHGAAGGLGGPSTPFTKVRVPSSAKALALRPAFATSAPPLVNSPEAHHFTPT